MSPTNDVEITAPIDTGSNLEDAAWLQQVIDLAVANVAAGGGPFGALIVRDGELLAPGVNRVTRDLDPTSHAEVCAIRAACEQIGDFCLDGCVLYTSCEPCPMCLAASLWARLDRVVYAADRHDAADGGFDDRTFYDLFGGEAGGHAAERLGWPLVVHAVPLETRRAPFEAWLAKADRTDY
ncbi:MAG: nucleoside deaminase [Nocardioides sp.]